MLKNQLFWIVLAFFSVSWLYAESPLKKSAHKLWDLNEIKFLGQSPKPLSLTPLWHDTDANSNAVSDTSTAPNWGSQPWGWQLFPESLIYPSYLAGVNESRLGGVWNHEEHLGWMWDITLGGRAPMLRYGNRSTLHPEGFQIDFEGSVHLRLDLENEMDMDSNDFRFGLPFSYGNNIWQIKTGYYHVSSHMGDERILRLQNQGIDPHRLNYVREALIFGFAYKVRPSIKLYAEADYAFWRGEETRSWHFQFGAEYSSPYPTNEFLGKPFAAVNILLLQERNYDGSITVQAGWQWRGRRNQLFRFGIQYFGGVSEQYEHIAKREHKIGIGFWYDF